MDIKSPTEAIRKRDSCRTFDGRVPDEKAKERLRTFFRVNTRGPFCNAIRFDLIDMTEAEMAVMNVAAGQLVRKLTLTGGAIFAGNAAAQFQPAAPFAFLPATVK